MISFKAGTKVVRMTPALFRIFEVLMMMDKDFGPIVVTSVNDSKHLPNSAHYRDEAVDIRCNDRPKVIDMAMCKFLEQHLGPSFLVLYEYEGTPNEHIHIQLRKGHTWNLTSKY